MDTLSPSDDARLHSPLILSAVAVLKRAPMPDPDAVAWMSKIALDTVVGRGLLPDDTGQEITACSMHPPIHAANAPLEFLYVSLTHDQDISNSVRMHLIDNVHVIIDQMLS